MNLTSYTNYALRTLQMAALHDLDDMRSGQFMNLGHIVDSQQIWIVQGWARRGIWKPSAGVVAVFVYRDRRTRLSLAMWCV